MTEATATIAAIVDDPGLDNDERLTQVLPHAGFWEAIHAALAAAGGGPGDFPIVIKPDLDAFESGSAAATDPRLVEALIDLLHDAGFTRVEVASAPDSSSLWAENRDVMVSADLLGYRYVTPEGRPYDVVDLAEDLVSGDWQQGDVLHGSKISGAWRDAGFRICFAKNKTDERNGYALCVDSLLGLLPLADKDYYYRLRAEPGDVVRELLAAVPPDFALIDATVSCHGSGGARAPLAIATHTLIACRDALLCDFAAALKMGLDPNVSPVHAKALRTIGLPAAYRIYGNLAPYPGWRNVEPMIADSTRRRDRSPAAARALQPWLQSLDSELFPLKNPVDVKANATLAPYFAGLDDDRGAFWTTVVANYLLAWFGQGLEAYRVLYDKDRLRRREVPLGLDLETYALGDYEAAAKELLPLVELLRDAPADAHGLRWRYQGEAVIFEFARTIPMPFDEFAARVDVSRTIQFMNDYIGGVAVPVAHDESGRVTHQAERNLYLPQPNYLVLYAGDVIDVTKLEFVEYSADRHRMFWKTILSENNSARYDDGIVTFARDEDGTRVSIFGRQLFALPPILEAMKLDLYPRLKADLVTHAYTTFFSRTLGNLEAVAEGRDVRIGRPWHDPEEAPGSEPLPMDGLWDTLLAFKDKYGDTLGRDLVERLRRSTAAPAAARIDEDGFAHFTAVDSADAERTDAVDVLLDRVAGEIVTFVGELGEAAKREMAVPVPRRDSEPS